MVEFGSVASLSSDALTAELEATEDIDDNQGVSIHIVRSAIGRWKKADMPNAAIYRRDLK